MAVTPRKNQANQASRANRLAAQDQARIVRAMAYDRERYKNHLHQHLVGALSEFYKAQLAEKNGFTRWIKHWRTETTRLLEQGLLSVLRYPIRGFKDRRKPFVEVATYLRADDEAYRRWATAIVLRDFEVRRLKKALDDNDTQLFWSRVQSIVDTVLELPPV